MKMKKTSQLRSAGEHFCLSTASSIGRKPAQRAFTLVELLVVIAIIAVLASFLFSALGKARQTAAAIGCTSNLRQLGAASMLYAGDNDGELVYAVYYDEWRTYWPNKLDSYVAVKVSKGRTLEDALGVFSCPSSTLSTQLGGRAQYGKNAFINGTYRLDRLGQWGMFDGFTLASIDKPSRYYFIGDSSDDGDGTAEREIGSSPTVDESTLTVLGLRALHQRKANIMFADGHVKAVAFQDIVPTIQHGQPPWSPRRPPDE